METFRYTAAGEGGKIVRGEVAAESKAELAQLLLAQGLLLIDGKPLSPTEPAPEAALEAPEATAPSASPDEDKSLWEKGPRRLTGRQKVILGSILAIAIGLGYFLNRPHIVESPPPVDPAKMFDGLSANVTRAEIEQRLAGASSSQLANGTVYQTATMSVEIAYDETGGHQNALNRIDPKGGIKMKVKKSDEPILKPRRQRLQ